MCQNIITHSNINPTRQLNKCGLNLNNSGIYVLVGNLKAFFTNFDSQEYKVTVSDNCPFVLVDGVSSNGINRMKKQRRDNGNNAIICHWNKFVQE